ncbi:hypothetical protein N7465_007742 [Penicillium sp. CMV-2018d]|nr:hypothetical protein N7465_007742 [Penicillium sp. CMV-2018d]
MTITLINHFDYPLRALITSTSLAVAGFTASGQSGDWSTIHLDQPLQSPAASTNIDQSDRGGLHSFRTIGRLVNYPPRSTTPFEPPLHFDYPLQITKFTSLTVAGFRASGQSADWSTIHLDHPLQSPAASTNIDQSDRGGLHSFRTIGRLVNHPPRSTTSITHYNHPLRAPASTSLTVAGFTASGQSADW